MQEVDKLNKKNVCNSLLIYSICLFIATLFFFLFSYNSPIYYFNNDVDYQWYMTLGNGLINGKIPYRDIFEHKGPIVYFITAFCCLFPNPGIVMLIMEILFTSSFFFIAYLICKKRLNTFYSLIAIPLLAFIIFSSWIRFGHGAIVENYCLPLLTYFLLCWIEFILENKEWDCKKNLILGICIGACFWIKSTTLFFYATPMLIWFIIKIYKRQYSHLIKNITFLILGFLIITAPILIFYAAHGALDDLWFAYFIFNTMAYPDTSHSIFISNLKNIVTIGPALIFFILYGIGKFTVRHKQKGLFLLISFLICAILVAWVCKGNYYYNSILIPYAILGLIEAIDFLSIKIKLPFKNNSIFILYFIVFCLAITIPFSILPQESTRSKKDYAPIVIAEIITKYKENNHPDTTLFQYKIGDQGIHNLTGILPNNYFFAKNYISPEQFPIIYLSFDEYIINQTSDFVITDLSIWNSEKDYLSRYYQPYTGDIETSTFNYTFGFGGHNLVLLFKKPID